MKRFISIVLALVVALSCFPAWSSAEGTPCFVVDTVTAAPGSSVEIELRTENNPGIVSAKFTVTFGSGLTLKNVVFNPDIVVENAMTAYSADVDSGTCILNWLSPDEEIKGDFLYATMTFDVAPGIVDGLREVSISYNPNDVFDYDLKNVAFEIVNGGVNVVDKPEGVNIAEGCVCTIVGGNNEGDPTEVGGNDIYCTSLTDGVASPDEEYSSKWFGFLSNNGGARDNAVTETIDGVPTKIGKAVIDLGSSKEFNKVRAHCWAAGIAGIGIFSDIIVHVSDDGENWEEAGSMLLGLEGEVYWAETPSFFRTQKARYVMVEFRYVNGVWGFINEIQVVAGEEGEEPPVEESEPEINPATESIFDLGYVNTIVGVSFCPDHPEGLETVRIWGSVDGENYYDLNVGNAVPVTDGAANLSLIMAGEKHRGFINVRYIKVTGDQDVSGSIELTGGDCEGVDPAGPYPCEGLNETGYGIAYFTVEDALDGFGLNDQDVFVSNGKAVKLNSAMITIAEKVGNGVYRILWNDCNGWTAETGSTHTNTPEGVEEICFDGEIVYLADDQIVMVITSSGAYETVNDGVYSTAKWILRGMTAGDYLKFGSDTVSFLKTPPETEEPGINVAAGRPYVVEGNRGREEGDSWNDTEPGKLTDGVYGKNASADFLGMKAIGQGNDGEASVIIDLGEVISFSKITADATGGDWGINIPTGVRFAVSEDGVNYSEEITVLSEDAEQLEGFSGNWVGLLYAVEGDFAGRYVKVTYYKPDDGQSNHIWISEIEVLKAAGEEYYPAWDGESYLWLHSEGNDTSLTYTIPGDKLTGPVDIEALVYFGEDCASNGGCVYLNIYPWDAEGNLLHWTDYAKDSIVTLGEWTTVRLENWDCSSNGVNPDKATLTAGFWQATGTLKVAYIKVFAEGKLIWEVNYNDGLELEKASGSAYINDDTKGVYWEVFHGDEPEPVRGDFDGDGIVTSDDAVYLLRHTLFAWIYPAYGYRDFDRDGRITSDDAVYLLRYTLFPDDYPIG